MSKKGPNCWNCGESRHIHHDCKKLKKKPSTSQPESANQVIDNSDDEAFGVSDIESDTDSMPELETIYDSNEEVDGVDDETVKDWFSDVGDDWRTPCGMGYTMDELSGVDSESSSFLTLTWNQLVSSLRILGWIKTHLLYLCLPWRKLPLLSLVDPVIC